VAKKDRGTGLGKEALFGPSTQPSELKQKSRKKDRTAPDALRRRTFMLPNELFERIQSTADEYGVGQNELVRHLLAWSLKQVDDGTHALPVKQRNTLE
jgi:hypothetical protein